MRKSMVWHTLWCFEMPTQKHSSIGLSSLREVEWSAAIFVWTKFHFPWDVYISDNIWNDMFDTFGRRIIPSLYAACNLLWKGHQKTTRSLICKIRGQKKPLTVGERILNHCTEFCLCTLGLIFIYLIYLHWYNLQAWFATYIQLLSFLYAESGKKICFISL